MAKKMVGISSAGSALPSTDMSTDANDLSSGFDISLQSDGRQQLTGVPDGSGGKISSSMPADLQGPHGFNMQNMNQSAQNIVTNINDAGMDKPSPDFDAFDAPFTLKTSAGTTATSKDGLNDLGNDAQGDRPNY